MAFNNPQVLWSSKAEEGQSIQHGCDTAPNYLRSSSPLLQMSVMYAKFKGMCLCRDSMQQYAARLRQQQLALWPNMLVSNATLHGRQQESQTPLFNLAAILQKKDLVCRF